MKLRVPFLSLAVVAVALFVASFTSRSALGVVVDACKLSASLTGSPFPCLKVVQRDELLSAYAILREPTLDERTILTPLSDVSGGEDPRLLQQDSANYFSLAWDERAVVFAGSPLKDRWTDAILAINAASYRTQDHLHIHMGCVLPSIKAQLQSNIQAMTTDSFRELNFKLERRVYWARLYEADSLEGINPFQAVSAGVPGAHGNMKNVTLAVVGAKGANGKHGFYLLADILSPKSPWAAAEELIDPKCRP